MMNSFSDNLQPINGKLAQRELESLDLAFYRFASKCFNDKLDTVFKGGCLLRHVLRENGNFNLRKTKDIDFEISEETYLTMEESYLDLVKFGKLRNSRDGKSLMTNMILFDGGYDCDVCITSTLNLNIVAIYEGYFGKFYGVKIEDMLSDNISSMSGYTVLERSKDIPDIYRIITTLPNKIDKQQLVELLAVKNLGTFECFNCNKDNVYKSIENLGFSPKEMCRVVNLFIEGILSEDYLYKSWNGSVWI